jgi:hypothetical protein
MMVDPDESVAMLAQAIDATLDACQAACAGGDMPSCIALLTAAEATSDALLEALGLADPDDPT